MQHCLTRARVSAARFSRAAILFSMPKSSSPANKRARLARLRAGRLGALEAKIPKRHAGAPKKRSALAARAGGQTVGGALPGGRITRGVGVVVLLALAGLGVRGLFGQKLDIAAQIERAARAKYIPQLEKQLGQKVEVGEFETDLLGRVVVHDVVIGRDAKLPTGALLRAKSLTIGLDIIGAALGRVKPLDAVNRIQIQSPQIYLVREPDGKFNLQSLLPPKKPGAPTTQWTGQVVVNDGRVFYFDRALPSRSGRKLKLDLRGIEATVNARGADPYDGRFTVAQTQLPDGSVIRDLSASGALALEPNRGWINAKFPRLPAPLLVDYAVPKGEVVGRRGWVSGAVRVALDGKTVTPTGELKLESIGVVTTGIREPLRGQPNAGAPFSVDDLNGALQFNNRALQSDGLRARSLGASWTARGSAALQDAKNPLFDLQIATGAVPVARLQTWAKPGAVPVDWRSGNVGLSARISGAPANARVSGALDAPAVRLQSKNIKNASFDVAMPRLRAAFVAAYRKGEPVKFAARAQVPQLRGNGIAKNYAGAGALSDVEITARGGSGPRSPLEISARAARWGATSPRYGATSGRDLNLVASTNALGDPSFAGKFSARAIQTGGINRAAFSPDAARLVNEIGDANLSVTFAQLGADFKRARITADVDLASVSLARAALPAELRDAVPASALTLRDLRARVGVRDGQIIVPGASASGGFGGLRVRGGGALRSGKLGESGFAVELPDIRLTAAQINPFLRARGVTASGDWRGRVAVVGASAQSLEATFELASNAVTLRDRRTSAGGVTLNEPSIRGQIRVRPGGLYQGEAVVAARALTARGGTLGPQIAVPVQLAGARAVGLRINANFAPQKWAARLDVTRAAVPVPGAIATVSDASILAQSDGAAVRLTRLSARFAGGRFDGTGALERGKVSAKVLAREVEAGALQRLLAAKSLKQARLQGQVSALLTIENGGQPRVEAQMAGGKVTVVQSGVVVPIDVAKARLAVVGKTAIVRSATLWSDGARFSGSGQVDLSGAGNALPAASGTLRVDALRLANWASRLEQLGVAGLQAQGWKQAALDGIVNGDFRLIAGKNPRVEGALELRAGTAFGSDIQSARARIAAVQSGGGVRLAVSDLSGRIEGAPFEGDLALDTARNTWRARLKTDDLDAGRAARLRALSARTDENAKISLLPIEGNLSADIDVTGVLKPDATEQQPFFVPRAGYARLVAGDVAWQGREVGTLRANLAISDNLARIETFELVPTQSNARTPATPRLTASGTIPLAPDAPGLDVKLEVGEAPLQFFADAARDARDALAGTGVTQTALDQIVGYADALPPGTRGEVAVRAAIGGTLRRPTIAVPKLTLRDGRAPLPYGGFSPPATLDAAFSYGNGIATISQGEFRLEKTEAQREADANDDDTLLRIEPGATVDINGDIDLGADVFNANLIQLATWVPALRGPNNAATLRGNLTEFSLRLSGQTKAPDVIGSVQAEDLRFNSYTIDRLRVARFEVMNGKFQIEPGNFTVAKGAYQSSAASGFVGWDWARGGPLTNGPINVNFPVQTSDFAALAGLFVPALSQVGADEFSGGVQVIGTLADPKLSGRVTLKDARFSLDGPNVAAPVGLKNVSGTIRFTPDERIEIDADDPLRGSLSGASAIQAPSTKKKNKKAPRVAPPSSLILAGDWKLRGGIGLDLSAESISNPTRAIGRQKYDLAFSVDNAAAGSDQLAGARDGDAAVLFKTGADGAQNLRWMIAASGRRKNQQTKGGGQMVSIGSLRLRDDFASGTPALLRSSALEFGTADDFQGFEVAKRIKLAELPDRRPQIKLDNFEWNYTGVGSGEVEGRLVLDNRDAIQQLPAEALELRNAKAPTLQESLKRRRTSQTPPLETRVTSAAQLRPTPLESPVGDDETLRVGGRLTLQNSTIVGAPAGGDGVVTKLSLFPDAPRFDVRLVLGEKVEFITAAFRTGLEGELVASGVPANPQLLGTVRTRNAQVRFPNARARVSEGRVTIALTRDPATDLLRTRVDVDATATGRAGQYLITLALNGPLDLSGEGQNLQNLRVDVTSNPPLSQSEAFAQLLGTAPRDSGDFSQSEANQAYAGAVLQVLSAPLFSGVERSVAQALGLDSVSFEYRFDEPLSVQFAKALNDRVFVTYRRSFGASTNGDLAISSGRTPFELSIEYQLRGNLRLGLKTDESRLTTLTLGQTFRF